MKNVRKCFDICRHLLQFPFLFFPLIAIFQHSTFPFDFVSDVPPKMFRKSFRLFNDLLRFSPPRLFFSLLFAWLDFRLGFNMSTLRLSYYFDVCHELLLFFCARLRINLSITKTIGKRSKSTDWPYLETHRISVNVSIFFDSLGLQHI